jgi:hypothetical protein
MVQYTGAAGAPVLTRAAVMTVSGTAAANTVVPVDTTAGAVTVTLPTAPAQGTVVVVKAVVFGAGNNVTVACGGSDVINVAGGATSLTLKAVNQAVYLCYDTATAIWTDLADDLPLSYLQTLFAPLASPAFTGTPTAPTAASSDVSTQLATDAFVASQLADAPNRRGLIAWTFPPSQILTEAASTGNVPSGDIILVKTWVEAAQTITNIVLAIGNAVGATLTANECFVGLYDHTGTLQGVSADQSTAWSTAGNANSDLVIPLTTPYAAPAGFYWIAYLLNGTTGPILCFADGSNSSRINFGLTAATAYAGLLTGAHAALPASFSPSGIAIGHSTCFPFLAGLS